MLLVPALVLVLATVLHHSHGQQTVITQRRVSATDTAAVIKEGASLLTLTMNATHEHAEVRRPKLPG